VDETWSIDELARRTGCSVDTIRFYQREGLLPPPARAGRRRLYGAGHAERLERIRGLRQRRFSLAAIRALLDPERPAGVLEGIFSGERGLAYRLEDLLERSGLDAGLAGRLREAGLLRDPGEFGRDAWDATDLDVCRAVAQIRAVGVPDDLLVALVRIYVEGVEAMQARVLRLFATGGGTVDDPDALAAFQQRLAASSAVLLPLVSEVVTYVHQRTLQRLTLRAIARGDAAEPDG
jgi:DNA-binding transcriptional MerR regulator